jgi:hypothetical protein
MPTTIDFAYIKQLVEEREAFIESQTPERRAELRSLQQSIDATLARAGKRNRLMVIMGMMHESLTDLQIELQRASLMAGVAQNSAAGLDGEPGRP